MVKLSNSDLRIGYVSTHQFPSTATDTEQAVRTIDALWQFGTDVELVMRQPKNSSQLAPETCLQQFYRVVGGFKISTYAGLSRWPLEADRAVCAIIASAKSIHKYDIIHTRSRGVAIFCVLFRQPVVFETYRELKKTAPVFSKILTKISRSRYFLGAICHSKISQRSLLAAGLSEQKTAAVYNGFDRASLEPVLTQKAARKSLNLAEDGKIVVYAGNVQRNKGLSVVLEMAKAMPQVQFLIVGGQENHLSELRQQIILQKLDKVMLVGWKKHDELSSYLYAADILIIPPTGKPLRQYGRTVLPMKLFLYLAIGRAIIAPATPDIEEILTHTENSMMPAPDDIEAAIAHMGEIFNDRKLAKKLGDAALSHSLKFTWLERAKTITDLYCKWQKP